MCSPLHHAIWLILHSCLIVLLNRPQCSNQFLKLHSSLWVRHHQHFSCSGTHTVHGLFSQFLNKVSDYPCSLQVYHCRKLGLRSISCGKPVYQESPSLVTHICRLVFLRHARSRSCQLRQVEMWANVSDRCYAIVIHIGTGQFTGLYSQLYIIIIFH